jgi:hypothetical protein
MADGIACRRGTAFRPLRPFRPFRRSGESELRCPRMKYTEPLFTSRIQRKLQELEMPFPLCTTHLFERTHLYYGFALARSPHPVTSKLTRGPPRGAASLSLLRPKHRARGRGRERERERERVSEYVREWYGRGGWERRVSACRSPHSFATTAPSSSSSRSFFPFQHRYSRFPLDIFFFFNNSPSLYLYLVTLSFTRILSEQERQRERERERERERV